MYMLYQQGVPTHVIASQFDVTEQTVRNGIRRGIQDQFRLSAEEERMTMADQLDGLLRQARKVLLEDQFLAGVNGKVAVNPLTGEPMLDWGHKRQTIALLAKLLEQKSKLLGLNMPVRHRVEITDKMDSEIERLATELAKYGADGAVPGKVIQELPAGGSGEHAPDA
jgi:hypothetical protein